MSVPFEKELENVARELRETIGHMADGEGDQPGTENRLLEADMVKVLKKHILPLLQAGQAMRDTAPGTDFDRLASEWDAARERLAQLEKR